MFSSAPILRDVFVPISLQLDDPFLLPLGLVLLVVVRLFAVPLWLASPHCPVFSKVAFNVQRFQKSSFCRYFPWHQASLDRMSGPGLFCLCSKDLPFNRPVAHGCRSCHGVTRLRESSAFLHLVLAENLMAFARPSVSESPRD